MTKRRTVLAGIFLLCLALAGCLDLPPEGGGPGPTGPDGADGDGGAGSGDDDLPPGPGSGIGCDRDFHVRNYTWNLGEIPGPNGTPEGRTMETRHCWVNWNRTEQDPARVYFVFARESTFSQGEWEATVYDADGEVFLHETLASTGVFCNAEGVEAPMGNWTVIHELRSFHGRLTARLCLDPPPDDCFRRCP